MDSYKNKNDNINNYLFFLECNTSKNITISKNVDRIDEIKTVLNINNYEDLLCV